MSESVEGLIAYCTEKGRVCPQPVQWDRLWKLLPNRRHLGLGAWEPPAPMSLAGWRASNQVKAQRLREHIEYASDHGALGDVSEFLRALREQDWHHVGE